MEPKYYSRVNQGQNLQQNFYNKPLIIWSDPSHYTIRKKLGNGRYSQVYSAHNLSTFSPCVIKILKPIRIQKVYRQIVVLSKLKGGPNIISLQDTVKDPISKIPCLVFQYINKSNITSLRQYISDFELRFYMLKLLQAIHFAHSKGIIHRDIKITNLVIDHTTRSLRLIDWGLSQFYYPGRQFNTRVATRYYKAPELLVDYRMYHYSLDIWSFGCVLASLVSSIQIFRRYPMFFGSNNTNQLRKISKILGSEGIYQYARKYNISINYQLQQAIGNFSKHTFAKYVDAANLNCVNHQALSLLQSCFIYDHVSSIQNERITSFQALSHPYFIPVYQFYQKLQSKGLQAFQLGSPQYATAQALILNTHNQLRMSFQKSIPIMEVLPPKPLQEDFASQVLDTELQLDEKPSRDLVHHLVGLYTRAIEYYSVIQDSRYLKFHERMQKMLQREDVQILFQAKPTPQLEKKDQILPLNLERTIKTQQKSTKSILSRVASDVVSQQQNLAQKLALRKKFIRSQTMTLNQSSISTIDLVDLSDEDFFGDEIEEIMERNFEEKVREITKIRVKYEKEISEYMEQGQLGEMIAEQMKLEMKEEIEKKNLELDQKRKQQLREYKGRNRASFIFN